MNISICGAGTMGRGIALSALQAGHSVVLFDTHDGVLSTAHEYIENQLKKSVDKGKLTSDSYAKMLKQLHTSPIITKAAEGEIVIEAIIERPEAKYEFSGTPLVSSNRPEDTIDAWLGAIAAGVLPAMWTLPNLPLDAQLTRTDAACSR